MSQPTGFKTARKENIVCKLKKLLYGLKQSSRQWYKCFDSLIRGKGTHEAITIHICNTISYLVESISIYSCMWMICSSLLRADLLLIIKKDLSSEFEIKDLGEVKKVLSMGIERDRKSGKVLNAYTIVLSFQVKNYYVF